jgi:periplasmic divalent cation tolerance protein
MSSFIQVSTTIDTQEGAKKIADALVEKRLAACVHVSGPITSTYWWQGQVEMAQEWVCIAKTRQDLYNAIEQAIRDVHSYDEPEILATPILTGSQGYLRWVAQETTQHS